MITRKEYTELRDWQLNPIFEGDIVKSEQGTIFHVAWSKEHKCFCLIQANKNNIPELQGERFELKPYMQPSLEVVGTIYDN